jgi:hypothetical protein
MVYKYECKYLYKYVPTPHDIIETTTNTATITFTDKSPVRYTTRAYVHHYYDNIDKLHDTGGLYSSSKAISFNFQEGDEIFITLAKKTVWETFWTSYCSTGRFRLPNTSIRWCFDMSTQPIDCRLYGKNC